MKKTAILLLAATMLGGSTAIAQTDPVIMTINKKPVLRSEFEYSYNKNNTQNVIDRKSVKEYVDLFINYKLKVEAALDAHLDTLASFRSEFATYRDQQVRPTFITSTDVENEAKKIYAEYSLRVNGSGGLVRPAHILVKIKQKATHEEVAAAKMRIDSIYQRLIAGDDFADMARRLSDDHGTAAQGGQLPWIEHGQTLKEFEATAFSLKKGEMSKPFETAAGWHIIKMTDRGMCMPYDTLRASIMQFIERRNIKDAIINSRLDSIAKQQGKNTTREEVLVAKANELATTDPQLKYLIQEYHDGLLLFEMSNRTVWEKAQNDKAGQEAFFKANRKRYRWAEARYKGIAYHTRNKADLAAVKKAVKKVPFEEWANTLRTTFNNDSILRIRVEKGIFAKGDNKTIDYMVFKTGSKPTAAKDFPFDAVYGKKFKEPETCDDVRSLVLADYQEQLEQQWVEQLRQRYQVEINQDVVETVNKH